MYLLYVINQEKPISVLTFCSNALQSAEDSGSNNYLHFPTFLGSFLSFYLCSQQVFLLSFSVVWAGEWGAVSGNKKSSEWQQQITVILSLYVVYFVLEFNSTWTTLFTINRSGQSD